jgi:transcriptional antiterminator RfaH
MNLKKPEYKWYALYTRVNNEKKILEHLMDEKIECYLPIRKTLRQWSDRKKWIEEPLFKCYLFVRVSYKEFFNVLSVPGVVCYVSFGGKPQTIPDYQITNIKTMVNQFKTDVVVSMDKFRKGEMAEVIVGPMKGLQGEIIEISGQYRILMRIESIGFSVHANIAKEEVKILDTAPENIKVSRSKTYSNVSEKRKTNNISIIN